MKEEVTIIGAGLVGSLLSILLSQKGYKVNVFEKRPNPLESIPEAGRSINLALSNRGIRALDKAGLTEKVLARTIAMKGRQLHEPDNKIIFQPYGKEGQQIYSVSRSELTSLLIEEAIKSYGVDFRFNVTCKSLDPTKKLIEFEDKSGNTIKHYFKICFGADGAFSAVRSELEKSNYVKSEISTLEHGYKELHINPGTNGEHLLEKHALHIWPRERFMLIALPNLDGSFTVTLFLPFQGKPSFDSLNTEEAVQTFFKEYFADALALMPDLTTQFFNNPTSNLATIKSFPWIVGDSLALIGDAAHAIVPFYGQGMNAGFEDCSILLEIIDTGITNWSQILDKFQQLRKYNTDAIADLALRNFVEMRDLVADQNFLLRKKIEARIHKKFHEYIPLYSMVTFSHIPYSKALGISKKQDYLMKKIMSISDISSIWDKDDFWEKTDVYLKEYFKSIN